MAEAAAVWQALALHEHDMDFADALHLSLAKAEAETIYTFDKGFAGHTPEKSGINVTLL